MRMMRRMMMRMMMMMLMTPLPIYDDTDDGDCDDADMGGCYIDDELKMNGEFVSQFNRCICINGLQRQLRKG